MGVETSLAAIEALRQRVKEERIKQPEQVREALREIIEDLVRFDPVSYTHLDVYKRQGSASGKNRRWDRK